MKTQQQSQSQSNRQRPAFEKLLIGPAMVLGESLTGGHYLDVLCLRKQMASGRFAPSYYQIHRTLISESRGFFHAFYRGWYPYGLMQSLKGLPVLFVQHETLHVLQQTTNMDPTTAGNLSGCLGGIAQAIFVTPFQKLKVQVVASSELNTLTPMAAIREVIRRDGLAGLCLDGLLPTCLRGGLDWGIRFGISLQMKESMLEEKRNSSEEATLSLLESMYCGLVGGATSALTQPIDNIVTNCQKPLPPGQSRDVVSVVLRMYRESGVRAFTRSMGLTVVDSAWHMMWMFGIGNILYDWMEKSISEPVVRSHTNTNNKAKQEQRAHSYSHTGGDTLSDYYYYYNIE